MKHFVIVLLVLITASCGIKTPYTDQVKEEFNLTPQKIVKVQFFTSQTVILERSSSSGNQTTGDDGSLVTNSSKTQDRVIIPGGTKCIYERAGEGTELIVRFEVGTGKVLRFNMRPNQQNGKYYLVADWTDKGGKLQYGNESYLVQAGGSSVHLLVKQKKLQKVKRKDRVVKGMKI